MSKARKRFVIFATICVSVLLFVLLGVINGVNFTMASQDADQLTKTLKKQHGAFDSAPETDAPDQPEGVLSGLLGPMGPDSPETVSSLRYFTFAFDKEGNETRVALKISAVTEEEALAWARSLRGENKTGWTRGTYRYRVYKTNHITYVTVIDQSRELLPCFRILIISAIGLLAGVLVSFAALMYIGKRLFKPLEEADRKQKRFIADAETEFKAPLTIINANTEIIERQMGETEQTQSINRQVKRMIGLVKNLSSLAVFDEKELTVLPCDLSALAQAVGGAMKSQFEEKGCKLTVRAGNPAPVSADSDAMTDLLTELLANALKFGDRWAELKVSQQDGHCVIEACNDTSLANGNFDQAFDRFTRLSNAQGVPGAGLGLSHVKEIAKAHNGRVSAQAADGKFILRVSL